MNEQAQLLLPILFVGEGEEHLEFFCFVGRVAEEDFDGLADFFAPRIAAGETGSALDAVERGGDFDQSRPNAEKFPIENFGSRNGVGHDIFSSKLG